jgi:uncharacterized protein (DUF2384 family)
MLKTPEKTNVHAELNKLRHSLGISQEEAAYILGTTTTTLSRWVNKKTAQPDPVHQEKLDRLVSVLEQASRAIRPQGVSRWFKTPTPLLSDLRPLDLLRSNSGLERVRTLLTSMEWGLPV